MSNTNWQFYTDPSEAWEAMFSDCANAQVSIDINQYIFEPDELGKRFIDLFITKAKQGVRVRMLCDAVGSRGMFYSDYPKVLSEAGVQIMFFNPISPWRFYNFTSWFFRDHKKLLIVDGNIAHTGGLGISARMTNWRDTDVRVAGPLVDSMQEMFARMWDMTVKNKFMAFDRLQSGAAGFDFVASSPILRPRRVQRYVHDTFIDAIRGARKYVYLTSPYFVPDWKFFRSLRLAAKRGVDVRLLLPAFPDIEWLNLAASSYFGLAFKSGIKIYKYSKSVLHAKSIIIDDEWGSVGSANLDNLSFKFNYEANIVSTNRDFNRDLKNQFLADLQSAKQVSPSEWGKRSRSQKFKELLTWPAHNLM